MLYLSIPESCLERAALQSNDTSKITVSQTYRKDKLQSDAAKAANTRDNQMVKGKHKKLASRNLGYLASSEPNSPTIASPGYHNTPEKQVSDSK